MEVAAGGAPVVAISIRQADTHTRGLEQAVWIPELRNAYVGAESSGK